MIFGKKAVCYAMVKNEEDIIELFIRHNLKFFDHIFITNNNSSDSSVLIIESLINEGLPVTLWHDFTLSYEQSRITTKAYHKIATLMDFDLFFPLDADELLTVDADFNIEMIENSSCYITSHVNYVTSSSADRTIDMKNRFKAIGKGKVFFKHDKNKFKHIVIAQGNHYIFYNSARINHHYIPSIRINHFGNRGVNHYLNKYIIGSQAMMILHESYSAGKSSFASHWYKEYKFIKHRKGNVSFEEYIQQVYGVGSIEALKALIIEDPIFSDIELKYTNFNTNLIYNLISNYENLEKEYWLIKKKLYLKRLLSYLIRRFVTIKGSINKRLYKIGL